MVCVQGEVRRVGVVIAAVSTALAAYTWTAL